MAGELNDRSQVFDLIDQAHSLLDRFNALERQDAAEAWEMVVELQALLDELRQFCPPRTFRRSRH